MYRQPTWLPLHSRVLWRAGMVLLCALAGRAQAEKPVVLCAEPSLGGDSLYWRAAPTSQEGRELAGFRADVTQAVFKRLGRAYTFRGDLPWSRCMRLVADGEIDFAVGAYYDEERARVYAFSKPFETLTPQVFLRADSPLRIAATSELKLFRGCGMNGSSYAHYGLKAGDLDLGAINYSSLVQKLKARRCDYFVEELEVIQAIENGKFRNDPELRSNAVAGAKAPTRHFVTQLGGSASTLIAAINEVLESLRRSGELDRLRKQADKAGS